MNLFLFNRRFITKWKSNNSHIPDPLDADLSLARNTIFNKGGRGDYQYKFRITATSGV